MTKSKVVTCIKWKFQGRDSIFLIRWIIEFHYLNIKSKKKKEIVFNLGQKSV